LYGIWTRARTTTIVKPFPASHFWYLFLSPHKSLPDWARWVCVGSRASWASVPHLTCRFFPCQCADLSGSGVVGFRLVRSPSQPRGSSPTAAVRFAPSVRFGCLPATQPLVLVVPLGVRTDAVGGNWCGRPGATACPGRMRCSDRSPGASWPPAPLESVDRWPLAIPETQIPGGSHSAGAAVRRCVRGVWTLHPRAVCRSLPAPARAAWWDPCVRTGAEGLSGGNWMVVSVPPVRRGRRCGRVSCTPLLDHTHSTPPGVTGAVRPRSSRNGPADYLSSVLSG
jgi:hypothetical protein